MVYLSLGTNLGDRQGNLTRAIELLNAEGITVLRESSIYETAPRDVPDQPWFLNMVIECETRYFPMQLMSKLLHIERELGRDRSANAIRGGPRRIDLDILLYNNAVIQTPKLTIPHPRLLERRFVLEPLLELVPKLKDPATKQPFANAMAKVRSQTVKECGLLTTRENRSQI